MTTNDNTHCELWRLAKTLAVTGLSRTLLYRLVAAGKFPRPVSLGGTAAKAFRSTEVLDWIDSQT